MTKFELVKAVASKIDGATQKDIAMVIDTLMEEIKSVVASGDKITLTGFGTFETVERAARIGRNPQTGETMTISAYRTPKFKPGAAFKDIVKR